jgi:hypothetical protein
MKIVPVGDAIVAVQLGAATAVKLDGKSALLWNERTQLALHDNRDFGADFWVRKQAGSGDAVLAALTGKDGKSFTFKWSDFPGAKEGQWQHLAFTYEGGGDSGDEAGLLRIFVNEKEVVSKNQTFDLPHDAAVSIGGWVKDAATPTVTDGFTGELGQTRIYNYDISLDEVEAHFREESPLYYRTPDMVAEKLYVDIDCRRYTDIPQHRHDPFHPDNLRKPWIRSWPNFGTLAGRLHNDVDTFMWDFTGSTPLMRMVDGAKVPVFQGKDRMVGEHAHEGLDGHTWMDPVNAKIQANEIKNALKKRFPEHEGAFEKGFAALAKDLDALDEKLKVYQAAYKDEPLLASHPAYNYIARRYGWNIKNLDLDPKEMPSDEVFQGIKDILKRYPARHLIWEAYPTKAIADRMRNELGLISIEFSPCELLSEHAQHSGSDYMSVMRRTLDNISVVFH